LTIQIANLTGKTLLTIPPARRFTVDLVTSAGVVVTPCDAKAKAPRLVAASEVEAAVDAYLIGEWTPGRRKNHYTGYNYSYLKALLLVPMVQKALDRPRT